MSYENTLVREKRAAMKRADRLHAEHGGGVLTRAELVVCSNLFQKFDIDHNDSIDFEELVMIVKHLGMCLERDALKELMNRVDVQEKGSIDFVQFIHMMQIWKEARMFRMLKDVNDDEKQTIISRIDSTLKSSLNGLLSTDSYTRTALYFLLLFITLYFWVVILHEDNHPSFTYPSQAYVEIIFSGLLLLDVGLSFVTANPATADWDGNTLKSVIRRYLSTWFIFDFMTSFPFDLVTTGTAQTVFRHMRLLKVGRVKLYFRNSGNVRLDSLYITVHCKVRPYIYILFWFVVIVHGLAEAFTMLKKHSSDVLLSYPTALYWVLYTTTSVGYGDVPIITDGEKLFASLVFVIGVICNGIVIARIISMLKNSDLDSEKNERMCNLLATLQFYEIPDTLQQEVLSFQEHLMQHANRNLESLVYLPDVLQESLSLHIRVKLISKVSMFEDFPECHIGLSRCLKPATARPDEYLVSYGEQGESMFIILHGYADVVDGDGGYLTTLGKRRIFGERSLLLGTPRMASVIALTFMDLLRLEKADLMALLPRYPKLKIALEEKMNSYEEGIHCWSPLSNPLRAKRCNSGQIRSLDKQRSNSKEDKSQRLSMTDGSYFHKQDSQSSYPWEAVRYSLGGHTHRDSYANTKMRMPGAMSPETMYPSFPGSPMSQPPLHRLAHDLQKAEAKRVSFSNADALFNFVKRQEEQAHHRSSSLTGDQLDATALALRQALSIIETAMENREMRGMTVQKESTGTNTDLNDSESIAPGAVAP